MNLLITSENKPARYLALSINNILCRSLLWPICILGGTMKKFAALLRNLAKDESGQGATEYILLLVVVVALALMFRRQITDTLKEKLDELGSAIGGFTVGN